MMDLRRLKEIFKNRNKIFEGLKNKMFQKEHVELIAEERLDICRANMCGYHDPNGTSKKAVYKGHESCAACGCRLDWKTRSLSSNCGLEELNLTPLWTAVASKQDEEMINAQINSNEV